jgi:hypothetical protein
MLISLLTAAPPLPPPPVVGLTEAEGNGEVALVIVGDFDIVTEVADTGDVALVIVGGVDVVGKVGQSVGVEGLITVVDSTIR